MKKNLIIFLLIPCLLTNASFFDFGNQPFADVKPESGQTRAQWYQKNLKESEQLLRNAIFETLRISPQEFAEAKKQAEKSVAQTEQEVKNRAQDIRGTWIKNDTMRKVYKADGSLWQKIKHVFSNYQTFDINDQKLNKIKQMLKDFGYTGEIATLGFENIDDANPALASWGINNAMECMQAYKSLIAVHPTIFLFDDADQAFQLRHEVSHIQNEDIVFERAIKNYVTSSFVKENLEDVDEQALQQKGLTLDDFDYSDYLLNGRWWNFHEYRADLDAMLAMKECKEFKERIKGRPQHDGYPLDWDYYSPYEPHARIPYMKDFTEGLRNDAQQNNG
jgi:hypothetical protein